MDGVGTTQLKKWGFSPICEPDQQVWQRVDKCLWDGIKSLSRVPLLDLSATADIKRKSLFVYLAFTPKGASESLLDFVATSLKTILKKTWEYEPEYYINVFGGPVLRVQLDLSETNLSKWDRVKKEVKETLKRDLGKVSSLCLE